MGQGSPTKLNENAGDRQFTVYVIILPASGGVLFPN